MHDEAAEYIAGFATVKPLTVIEIGSRNINGTSRVWFPNALWTGLDIIAGEMVDVVIDAEHYEPEQLVDLVVCCEVFEHAARWVKMVEAAFGWLKPGGRMIVTCAGPDRIPHSAIDGECRLLNGEHYANISQEEMRDVMQSVGFTGVAVSGPSGVPESSVVENNTKPTVDTYAAGTRP